MCSGRIKEGNTAFYGLIGYPVKHSFSPAMHNAAFRACQINAEYKLFTVEPRDLEDFLLRRKEVAGFNITIPHKVKAREILEKKFPLDGSSDSIQEDFYYVKLSGAINTVKREGETLRYWNTDTQGFLRSLSEDLVEFDPKNKNVLIVGCGGAGRAIVAGLSWRNTGISKIYVYDIREEAVSSLRKHLLTLPEEWQKIFEEKIESIPPEKIPEVIKKSHLLVNATPLGMKEDDPSVIDKNLLHKDLFVYDVVYNRETELLKAARGRCRAACGGLNMLLYQGVKAWELWMEREAPVEVMRQALEKELNPDSNRDFAK